MILIDSHSRYLVLACDLNNTTFTIENLYAPNVGQLKYLHTLFKKIKCILRVCLLVCGDFNSILGLTIDTTATIPRVRIPLLYFVHDLELYDAWRCLLYNKKDYTYFSVVHKSYSRIDMCLADLSLLHQVTHVEINSIT